MEDEAPRPVGRFSAASHIPESMKARGSFQNTGPPERTLTR
jgi:hypothetical protein